MMRKIYIPLAAASALVSSALLSGCGFTPLHGTTGGAAAPLANVDVQLLDGRTVVDNQAGFFVNQRLNDRIGVQSETAPYALRITPSYRRARFGLTDSDIASRYDITVGTQWALVDTKTGKTVDSGRTSTTTTFGAPAGPYGVITADNVGVEQAAGETADKLILELAKYFAGNP